jgi:hypothetical protein
MNWLDALRERGMQAKRLADPALMPAEPRQPKPEIKSVWVQTCASLGPGDPGAAEPAFYFVADGVLTMCDSTGKPTGKTNRLAADDHERRIAGRLWLQVWRKDESEFNRRLNYPRSAVA